MDFGHLCILLLATVAVEFVSTQNPDELQIPVENDNQFPPENHLEEDTVLEGSGVGVLEEPEENIIESTPLPKLEDSDDDLITHATTPLDGEFICPSSCVCNTEGISNKFIVDCSGLDLTEIPAMVDSRTTTLNLQNNKLKEITKDVSNLKNLQILNASNNSIMEVASGSISELPELTHLLLENNRLLEYPQDLKNSFILTKLEELHLGGNDIRTEFSPEWFTNFKSLQKLTIPTSSQNFLESLCNSLKGSLETICTESCSSQTFECPDVPQNVVDDELIQAVLPGTIAFSSFVDDNIDPVVNNNDETTEKDTTEPNNEGITTTGNPVEKKDRVSDFFSAVIDAPSDGAEADSNAEISKTAKSDDEIKVGATTTETKTGGVDKSVIGFVVAGMVLVVAGITIKKNWSSISKRFSSSPRPNERGETTANGTTPEEVPLQDKSPV